MAGESDGDAAGVGLGMDLAELQVCQRAAALAGLPVAEWIAVAAVATARRLEQVARGEGVCGCR